MFSLDFDSPFSTVEQKIFRILLLTQLNGNRTCFVQFRGNRACNFKSAECVVLG